MTKAQNIIKSNRSLFILHEDCLSNQIDHLIELFQQYSPNSLPLAEVMSIHDDMEHTVIADSLVSGKDWTWDAFRSNEQMDERASQMNYDRNSVFATITLAQYCQRVYRLMPLAAFYSSRYSGNGGAKSDINDDILFYSVMAPALMDMLDATQARTLEYFRKTGEYPDANYETRLSRVKNVVALLYKDFLDLRNRPVDHPYFDGGHPVENSLAFLSKKMFDTIVLAFPHVVHRGWQEAVRDAYPKSSLEIALKYTDDPQEFGIHFEVHMKNAAEWACEQLAQENNAVFGAFALDGSIDMRLEFEQSNKYLQGRVPPL